VLVEHHGSGDPSGEGRRHPVGRGARDARIAMHAPRLSPPAALAAVALFATPHASAFQVSTTYDKPAAAPQTGGPAAGAQRTPRCDAGGAGALVVWSDDRTSVDASFRQSGDDVYGQLLDALGQPIGPQPLLIAAGAGEQTGPQVSWNGSHWLVVWNQQLVTGSGFDWRLHARRVAADGTLLDPTPIELPMTNSAAMYFDVEDLGGDWVVMTEGASDGAAGIEVARVAANGGVLDASPIELVSQSVFLNLDANVETAGNRMLLVYGTGSGLVGRLYDHQLQPVGAPLAVPTVFAASNDTHFYFAWHDGTNMRGTPMDTSGALLAPNGFVIAAGGQVTGPPSFESMAWDGATWWIAWQHVLDGIEVQRVRPTGVALGAPIAIDPANADEHALPAVCARPGGGVQLVWSDIVGTPVPSWDVYTLGLASNGAPGTASVLSLSAPSHARCELAPGPDDTLLATAVAHTSNAYTILAWRLDSFGNALEAPFVVDEDDLLGAPAAAWNGTHWLVVWTNGNDVLARRYDVALQPVDPAPVFVMSGVDADVEALGDDFLVVAGRFGTLPQTLGVAAVRIDGSTGALLDTTPIALGLNHSRSPRVVAVAGRWLVVWQRTFSFSNPQGPVEGAFVEASGATLGAFTVTTGTGGQPDVAIGANDAALVVWRQNSLANADNSIRARRLDGSGQFVGADFLVAQAEGRQLDPAVAFDGDQWVVVYEDTRERLFELDERTGVFATRVASDGSILDPNGFRLWSIDEQAQDPAAAASHGDVVVAAAHFDAASGIAAWHTNVRRIGHWQDVGAALPGAVGAPVLDGRGRFALGATIELQVSNALPGTFGWYVVGASEWALPLFGGVLTPAPDLLVPLATDPNGRTGRLHTFAFSPVVGANLWVQAWLVDPTAPQGLAATNAVRTAGQ